MKQLEFVNNGFSIEAADGSGAKQLAVLLCLTALKQPLATAVA